MGVVVIEFVAILIAVASGIVLACWVSSTCEPAAARRERRRIERWLQERYQ